MAGKLVRIGTRNPSAVARPRGAPTADGARRARMGTGRRVNEVYAAYTLKFVLGAAVDSQQNDGVSIRPEPFVLERITWSSTGGAAEGDGIEVTWSDEFTKFLGDRNSTLTALLGNTNGFLDLTRPIRFQGKQNLSASLRRIAAVNAPSTVYMTFHGYGELPRGVQASGEG